MKIVHICLADGYTDNSEYQENILAKYHRKAENDVTVISTQYSFNKGNWEKNTYSDYYDKNSVLIKRIPYLINMPYELNRRLGIFGKLNKILTLEDPDIIFIHNFQFLSVFSVTRYAKNNNKIVFVDSHVDYENSGKNIISKYVFHKLIWRLCAKRIQNNVKKFYGVLPARLDFLIREYHLPTDKCELLLMGADDEYVEFAGKKTNIVNTRNKLGVHQGEILIVTGGKINGNRPETLNLMEAVGKLADINVRLVIFGSVASDLQKNFDDKLKYSNIEYIGWLDSRETYNLMAAADIVVFPGLHSVMWEQAVALGVPTIFKDIIGFHHVDLGGNCVFINDVTVDGIKRQIENIVLDPEKYNMMKSIASENGKKVFSYKNIAMRSINLEVE